MYLYLYVFVQWLLIIKNKFLIGGLYILIWMENLLEIIFWRWENVIWSYAPLLNHFVLFVLFH